MTCLRYFPNNLTYLWFFSLYITLHLRANLPRSTQLCYPVGHHLLRGKLQKFIIPWKLRCLPRGNFTAIRYPVELDLLPQLVTLSTTATRYPIKMEIVIISRVFNARTPSATVMYACE